MALVDLDSLGDAGYYVKEEAQAQRRQGQMPRIYVFGFDSLQGYCSRMHYQLRTRGIVGP